MSSYRLLPKLHLYSYRKCPNSSPLLSKEGWLRHQENIAKPQKLAQTGWLSGSRNSVRFAEIYTDASRH